MKFRYKVLIINIILLSIGIGTVGFLMVDHNEALTLDAQIKNGVDENNMLQSAIEYQLLSVADKNSYAVANTLSSAGPNVIAGMSANRSAVYILYEGKSIYSNASYQPEYVSSLAASCAQGQKHYLITAERGGQFLYTSSCSVIAGETLNIINRRDISEAYDLMKQQLSYFQLLLLIVLVCCSAFMLLFTTLLTRPLERLNRLSKSFADGDYSVRADIRSSDEVGMLAATYNHMADSVENHIGELHAMVERQERFVADFTHEIKTPMTSIIGYADTIRSRELSREDQIMAASYIFSEGKRLETMSMKLFDLLYTKQQKIEKKPFHAHRLMSEIEKSVYPALNACRITLALSVEDALLRGDIDLLKSAFINLIDNAKKASPEGSRILFSGSARENAYQFIIQDFGTGIAPEHLSHITEAFYMVDKSRSRREGGAGLGLSLAHLIFAEHGADMKIESTPGEGTIITVLMPLKKEVADREEA